MKCIAICIPGSAIARQPVGLHRVDIRSTIRRLSSNRLGCRRVCLKICRVQQTELIIPVGATGYVALYEIVSPSKVVVLALRHQREEDYH